MFETDYDLASLQLITPKDRNFEMGVTPRYYNHYVENSYETLTANWIANWARGNGIFIDIGAHFGFYSMLVAKKSSQCKVLAFEPSPVIFDILKRNADLNEFPNINAHKLAVSDKNETHEFKIAEASDLSGFYDPISGTIVNEITVETIALDQFLDNEYHNRPAMIKIDVEGHEINVLNGMKDLLTNHLPDLQLMVKYNPQMLHKAGYQSKELLSTLFDFGFQVFMVDEQTKQFIKIDTVSYSHNPDYPSQIHPNNDSANLLCIKKEQALSVVFFSHLANLHGAERSLLSSVTSLTKDGVLCTVIMPGDGPLRKPLEDAGAAVVYCGYGWWAHRNQVTTDERTSILRENFAKVINTLKPQLERINPDIIISKTVVIPWGAVCAYLLNKPHIWHIHEFGTIDHNLNFFYPIQQITEFIHGSSNKIFTNSQATRRFFFGSSNEDKVSVIIPEICIEPDPAELKDAQYYFNKKNAFKMAILGWVSEGKGQADAVLAVRELARKGRDVELLVVGNGHPEYVKWLHDLVAKNNLGEFIQLINFQHQPYPIFEQTDVILVCSRNEAFGRVTVEGMLCAKPVIGTNTGGTPEIIIEGETGLLYAPNDIKALVEKIEYLIDNPDLRASMGNKGLETARKRYAAKEAYTKLKDQLFSLKGITNQSSLDFIYWVIKNIETLHTWEIIELAKRMSEQGEKLHTLTQQLSARDQQTKTLESQIAENEQQITAFKSQIAENEQQITAFKSQIADSDQQIKSQKAVIANHEHKISGLQSQSAQRQQQYQALDAKLAEREQILQHLNTTLLDIYSSTAWKLIKAMWRVRLFLAPHGSRRERIGRSLLGVARRKRNNGGSASPGNQDTETYSADVKHPSPFPAGQTLPVQQRPEGSQKIYETLLISARGEIGPEYVALSDTDLSQSELPVRLIAFYLPQYHPIPENDHWWGKGFTEWTNVSKAVPQFAGHYQPHLPGELGFYDLRLREVQRRQVELAKKYGIHGFCIYYYWFDGKRLLEQPLDNFVSDPEIDFPFCLCWANENWTRRWDGLENDILIAQKHTIENDIKFIRDVSQNFNHPNYIKINKRPVLVVYRAHDLNDPAATARRWRDYCLENNFRDPYLIAAQTFGFCEDPRTIGFDAAVEFPPFGSDHLDISNEVKWINTDFNGHINSYPAVKRSMIEKDAPSFKLFKTVIPSWDNTARKGESASIYLNSTPALYQEWLENTIHYSIQQHTPDERFVFINAWNEWAEGTHLEPDRKYGYAYLQATANALEAPIIERNRNGWKILFITHNAHIGGTQLLLLDILHWLKKHTDLQFRVVCLEGGNLLPKFLGFGEILVWSEIKYLPAEERLKKVIELCDGIPDLIYGNTIFSGQIYDELITLGAPILTHVHELKSEIPDYPTDFIQNVIKYSEKCIASSNEISKDLIQTYGYPSGKIKVAHSLYQPTPIKLNREEREKQKSRAALGLEKDKFLIFGYGIDKPFRKGADLFIYTARQLLLLGQDNFHFYWVGNFDELDAEEPFGDWKDFHKLLEEENLHSYITFLGPVDNPQKYYCAGDLFLFTSREETISHAMLEAVNCSLAVLFYSDSEEKSEIFNKCGGFLVPIDNIDAMAEKINYLINNPDQIVQLGERAKQIMNEFYNSDLIFPEILSITREIAKKPPRVSIIVPNYNHAKYLENRLNSIFNQSFQDFEVILLDDNSTDNSLELLEDYSKRPGVKLIKNSKNSGNPFKQWLLGIEHAKGELIWIAESDDYASIDFLSSILPVFDREDVLIAYGDISYINPDGSFNNGLAHYYDNLPDHDWKSSHIITANRAFAGSFAIKNIIPNVSGAIFRKPSLTPEEKGRLTSYTFAGDWYFYALIARGGSIAFCKDAKSNFRLNINSTSRKKFFSEDHISEHNMILQDLSEIYHNHIDQHIIDQHVLALWQILKHSDPKFSISDLSKKITITKTNRRLFRICIASLGFSIGGGELVPIEIANRLRTLGHHITFLAMKNFDFQDPPILRSRLREDIPVIYWKEIEGNFGDFLVDYGVELINSHNVGVELHLYNTGQHINIPYIVSLHGGYETIPNLITNDFIEYLRRNVDEWLYLTDKNIKILCEKGLVSAHFTRVFNASVTQPINFQSAVDIRSELEIENGATILVLASRAIYEKGWQIAIDVTQTLRVKTGRIFHLILIGDGPDFHILKNQNDEKAFVTFLGRIDNPYPIIKECDFGIFPSTYAGESFPLFILDCLQCGLPVITTDIGEVSQIMNAINGEIPGVMVPNNLEQEHITKEMVQGIITLLNDDVQMKSAKKLAIKLAEHFSLDRLIDKYLEVFIRHSKSSVQTVFRDPNSLYQKTDQVGSVNFLKAINGKIIIDGLVSPENIVNFNLTQIIIVDRSNRYVTGVHIKENGKWQAEISRKDIGNDNNYLEIKVFASGSDHNFIYPIGIPSTLLTIYQNFLKPYLPENSDDIPSIKDELLGLITKATRLPYMSHSIFEDIITGNTYQTVALDSSSLKGGRPSREKFLSQIDFRNKTVLDLGANTGENSRIARRLGASLVDGYEYDPFFVEIGRTINAYQGITRVSLFQGDCTRKELYENMEYDMVLTLAVWVYTEGVMDEIEKITDFLIFETHTLDHGIEFYYQPVQVYFPHIISLGYTEKPLNPHQSRMFFVCGKNLDDLNVLVNRKFLKVKPYFDNGFIRRYNNLTKDQVFDLAEKCYQKHKNITNYHQSEYIYGTDTYFEVFLAGLYQFIEKGILIENLVDEDNLYLSFLKNGIEKKIIDPNLKQVSDNQNWLSRKVSNKYEDAIIIINGLIDRIPPVEIVPDHRGNLVFSTIDNQEIKCFIFDGHHRFFMAELVGEEKIHYIS
jgi:FkbM family methyltransferase